MYADIAVCLPLSRTFAYELNEAAGIGCRVVVPFRNRETDGFVVALRRESPPGIHAKTISKVVDREALIRPDIFELCRWISDYYVAPLGEVLKSALPPGITAKHVAKISDFGLRTSDLTGLPKIRNPKSEIRGLNCS